MKNRRWILALGLLALVSLVAPFAYRAVFARECTPPMSCQDRCSQLFDQDSASLGLTDKAGFLKTCTWVNCDDKGYFHGAWNNYQTCLSTKAAEDAAAEKKRLQDLENQRNEQVKQNKLFTTTLEFGKDVKAGDTVKAKRNETLIIRYADGAEVRLMPYATMKLTSYETVDLVRGKALFMVNYLEWTVKHKRKLFEVRCSGGSGAIRGTQFYVDAKAVSATFRVLEGTVAVSNPKGDKTVEVEAGNLAVARKSGSVSKPKAFDVEGLKKELGLDEGASE